MVRAEVLVLFLILEEMFSVLHSENVRMMFAVGLSYMDFIIYR